MMTISFLIVTRLSVNNRGFTLLLWILDVSRFSPGDFSDPVSARGRALTDRLHLVTGVLLTYIIISQRSKRYIKKYAQIKPFALCALTNLHSLSIGSGLFTAHSSSVRVTHSTDRS